MGFSGMTTVSDFTAHQTATAVVARKGTAGPRPSAVDAPATLTDEHGDVYVEPGLTPLAAREANRSALVGLLDAAGVGHFAVRGTVYHGTVVTEGMKLDAVLDLEAPEDEVVKRIAGRRVCRNEPKHVFHVTYTPPKKEGVCDVCGGELYQRDDDSEETVRKRLEVYHTQTEPIIDYYKSQGLVATIAATGPVDEVTRRALEALKRDQ